MPRQINVVPLRKGEKGAEKVRVPDQWYIGKVVGFSPESAPEVGKSVSTGALTVMHLDGVEVVMCKSFRWVD